MFKSLIITSLLFVVQSLYAHEGHDHGPSQVQAPKGGIVRSLETVHLELLSKGKNLNVYVYDMNFKPEDVTKFPVSATVALPRKKAQALTFSPKGDHWEAEFDAKGAHRYTLEMKIKQDGHEDKVKFTVEPGK